jgi:hypothetical protein
MSKLESQLDSASFHLVYLYDYSLHTQRVKFIVNYEKDVHL